MFIALSCCSDAWSCDNGWRGVSWMVSKVSVWSLKSSAVSVSSLVVQSWGLKKQVASQVTTDNQSSVHISRLKMVHISSLRVANVTAVQWLTTVSNIERMVATLNNTLNGISLGWRVRSWDIKSHTWIAETKDHQTLCVRTYMYALRCIICMCVGIVNHLRTLRVYTHMYA